MRYILFFTYLISASLLASCTTQTQPNPDFPHHLIAPVTLPDNHPIAETQLAYCEYDTTQHYLDRDRVGWQIKVGHPFESEGFYMVRLVPHDNFADLGCFGFPNDTGAIVHGLSWSPDGKNLLYNYGNSIIAIAQIEATGQLASALPLLNPPQYTFYRNAHAPSWSPQGDTIAFISQFQEGPGEIGVPGFMNSVFVSQADGSEPRYFQQETRLPGVVSHPVWSHDGTQIAHILPPPASGIGLIDVATGQVEYIDNHLIPQIPASERELHATLPIDSLTFLPGDNIILFLTNSESETADILWGLVLETHELIELYRGNIKQIELSPDGKSLAMVVASGVNRHRIELLSLETKVLTETLVDTSSWEMVDYPTVTLRDLDWTPDGNYLAFSANPNGNFDLFAWDKQADDILQLTNTPTMAELLPKWRPIDYSKP